MSKERFLRAAHQIGRRLAREALWDGERCTWMVHTVDRDPAASTFRSELIPAPADVSQVYQGSAGIALFLGELFRATGDLEVRRVAWGGIRHALAGVKETDVIGLHSGSVGVGYAAVSVGDRIGDDVLVEAGRKLLLNVVGKQTDSHLLDVVAGAAGIILALIDQATAGPLAVDADRLLEAARQFGDHLVEVATLEAVGWSWKTAPPHASTRNLLGYAHGASGVAHALIELFRVTGDSGYRYAAEQAFLYERRFYDLSRGNWPDFRDAEVMKFLRLRGWRELQTYLREGGRLERAKPQFSTAWCHGAGGIGLARLRGYEVLGDEVLKTELANAVDTTRKSVGRSGENYSLCHGVAGNCEVLLAAARVLDCPDLLGLVEDVAGAACERHAGDTSRWPSGTLGQLPDPSLMLGEAGVGLFLLRLCDSSIRSILSVGCGNGRADATQGEFEKRAQRLQDTYTDFYFGRTLNSFSRVGCSAREAVRAGLDSPRAPGQSDPGVAFRVLSRLVWNEADPHRKQVLDDAFCLEREVFRRSRDVARDRTALYLASLARLDPSDIDWADRRFCVSQHASLVRTQRDWDTWLKGRDVSEPDESDGAYIVLETVDGLQVQRMGVLAASVVSALQSPATLQEVVRAVASRLARVGVGEDVIAERVLAQVKLAYEAGILNVLTADGVESNESGEIS